MVYLHVPFCRSFCSYCDFYSEIACRDRDRQSFEAFAEAVCAETSRRRDAIETTRDLNTLYIGGGTPSVLPPSCLERIVTAIGGAPFTEFTLEVNPEDIVEKGPAYVRALLATGVNRISMGVQSLDDGILRWMNRRHDAAHAREAFRILRGEGVPNLSVDLIFGLSQLSEAVFADTLEQVLNWRPEHVSAYQLSIEEGSALGRLVREGRYTEAPQEQCAAQYALLCKRLQAAGYVHYEISNWALPGREALHNSAYWTRHPYVGLGPAAHSFDGAVRSWNGPLPPEGSGSGWDTEGREKLSAEEAREERIMLGLRTARGIPETLCDPQRVASLLASGSLLRTGGRLRIPEDRWFVSDDILADLV
ncbi:MAG: coproporphyrinogen III oxidase family protein [Bacteroidales bacterium]|nr:coproporphyrinogen III oxidase family protein [Bacteroidales bacterium]